MYPPYDPNDPRDEYGTPLGGSDPNEELQNAIASIFKQYQPQHAFSDQLSSLIGQFPQRAPEPTGWRKLLAIGGSLGGRPMAVSDGQPIGYVGNSPEQMAQSYETLTQAPYHRALNDWLAKVKPIETGAQDERYNNTNMRAILNAQANQLINERKVDLQGQNIGSQIERREAQTKSDMAKRAQEKWNAEHPDMQLVFDAQGNVTGVNRRDATATPVMVKPAPTSPPPTVAPDGAAKSSTTPDTTPQIPGIVVPVKQLQAVGPIQQIDEKGAQQRANTRIQGGNQLANTDLRISGEKQLIPIRAAAQVAAQATAADRRLADQEELAKFKETLKEQSPTSPEITQMHSARKMLKQLDTVEIDAVELAKRGNWGLIQSAIRNTAAKYNWTGSPQDIQKSADAFAHDIKISALSQDTATSKFAADLALLASGLAYVHGQGRAGSSPTMIQNMKDLLTSAGDFGGFQGRLLSVKGILNTYAAEPKGGVNNDIQSAIDEILKSRGGK